MSQWVSIQSSQPPGRYTVLLYPTYKTGTENKEVDNMAKSLWTSITHTCIFGASHSVLRFLFTQGSQTCSSNASVHKAQSIKTQFTMVSLILTAMLQNLVESIQMYSEYRRLLSQQIEIKSGMGCSTSNGQVYLQSFGHIVYF